MAEITPTTTPEPTDHDLLGLWALVPLCNHPPLRNQLQRRLFQVRA
jgi:hypothetical protein